MEQVAPLLQIDGRSLIALTHPRITVRGQITNRDSNITHVKAAANRDHNQFLCQLFFNNFMFDSEHEEHRVEGFSGCPYWKITLDLSSLDQGYFNHWSSTIQYLSLSPLIFIFIFILLIH